MFHPVRSTAGADRSEIISFIKKLKSLAVPTGSPGLPHGIHEVRGGYGVGGTGHPSPAVSPDPGRPRTRPEEFSGRPRPHPLRPVPSPATDHGRNPPSSGRSVMPISSAGIVPIRDREGCNRMDSSRSTGLMAQLPKAGGRNPDHPGNPSKTIPQSGNSSVGRASVSQTEGHEFETRLPLHSLPFLIV